MPRARVLRRAADMKRTICIASLGVSLFAYAPTILAQDAAAPFRRASPSPAEATPTPSPAETPRDAEEEEPPRRAEPAATPTPTRAVEQTPTPEDRPAAENKETPASTPAPARRVLDGEPVRAVDPRPPGSRRPRPAEPEDEGEDRASPARPPKPAARDEEPDRSGSPPQPRTSAGRGAALDYWDDDPASAVKALERKWQKALVNKDVDTINDLLARDFVATSSTGRVGSKSTVLNTIRRDKNEYQSANARNMSVRMLGPRVAVVTGIANESGTTPDGRTFRNSRRFTDTWMLRSGKWVCVASQATELPKD